MTDASGAPRSSERRRTRLVSAAVIGALVLGAIVWRHPLVAWFTGSSGGSTGSGSGSMGAMSQGSGSATAAGAASGSDVAYYTCSMHPAVHAPAPGKCPICSMDLTPVTREAEQAGVIHIEDSRRSLLGIRTTKVVTLPRSWRARRGG